MQNAAARRLAVPDLTTTVLTMTITAVAADLRRGNVRVAFRRVLAVVAIVGAVLVLRVSAALALAVSCILVATSVVSS